MNPDESVLAQSVVYPGHELRMTMTKPTEDSIAVYFLFTEPTGRWKVYLPTPTSSIVALQENQVVAVAALPDYQEPPEADGVYG